MVNLINIIDKTQSAMFICVTNTGIYKDKPYQVKLSIGKIYRAVYIDELSIRVVADDGATRLYGKQYFKRVRHTPNVVLKDFK